MNVFWGGMSKEFMLETFWGNVSTFSLEEDCFAVGTGRIIARNDMG